MRTNLVAGAAVCIVAVGVALAGDAAAERKKLEGSWNAVSGQQGGKELSKKQLLSFDFKGDKVVLGNDVGEFEFTLNPDKKPNEIDIKGGFVKGQFSPKGKGAKKGIYQLKDDTLTVHFAPPGKPRPTKLESREGEDSLVFVLKREKK